MSILTHHIQGAEHLAFALLAGVPILIFAFRLQVDRIYRLPTRNLHLMVERLNEVKRVDYLIPINIHKNAITVGIPRPRATCPPDRHGLYYISAALDEYESWTVARLLGLLEEVMERHSLASTPR